MKLPAAVRLRPHHPLLCRTEDSIQFGAHRRSIEVTDLSPPLWQLLRRLPERLGWPVGELVELGVRSGAAPAEVLGLLTELYAAGALLDDELVLRRAVARRSASVLLQGDGPLLLPVATGLGAAGVGRLGLWAGSGPADQRTMLDRLRAELIVVAPRTQLITARPSTRVDMAVVTDTLAPSAGPLAGPPRLVVRVCDELGLVGPLVLPHRAACLSCVDLHRTEQDPLWPTLHGQLGRMTGSASASTLLATAGLAVEQALLYLDGLVAPAEPPPTLDAVLELDLQQARLHRKAWSAHPDCECGAADTVSGWPVFGSLTSAVVESNHPVRALGPTTACAGSATG